MTALITGASTGIGYELSKLFAADGYRLLLVARDEARLQAAAQKLRDEYKVEVRSVAIDLSLPAADAELARLLQNESIDVLVNNAGYGSYGAFATSDMKKTTGMIELNVSSLTTLTRLVLPSMLERKNGKVLNVASVAGFLPGPFMAAYFASKAYVVSFSTALREELRDTGVMVSCLCPGATPTSFQQTAGYELPTASSGSVLDAAAVARQGYDGLKLGKNMIVPGWKNKLMVFGARFSPLSLTAAIVRRWNS